MNNKVKFLRDGECPYTADIAFVEDHSTSKVGDLWSLSNISVSHNAEKIEKKEPTCTTDGNIEYWYCSDCMKFFIDKELKEEVDASDVIIKATGHEIEDRWNVSDIYHWHVCKKCGTKIDEEKHQFIWVIDKEASSIENGLKHEECQICKYRLLQIEIPSEDSDIVIPETGNNSHEIVLFLFVSGVLGAVVLAKIRHSYKK